MKIFRYFSEILLIILVSFQNTLSIVLNNYFDYEHFELMCEISRLLFITMLIVLVLTPIILFKGIKKMLVSLHRNSFKIKENAWWLIALLYCFFSFYFFAPLMAIWDQRRNYLRNKNGSNGKFPNELRYKKTSRNAPFSFVQKKTAVFSRRRFIGKSQKQRSCFPLAQPKRPRKNVRVVIDAVNWEKDR